MKEFVSILITQDIDSTSYIWLFNRRTAVYYCKKYDIYLWIDKSYVQGVYEHKDFFVKGY